MWWIRYTRTSQRLQLCLIVGRVLPNQRPGGPWPAILTSNSRTVSQRIGPKRKRLAEVMVQPIGHYRGWCFELGCQACRQKRVLTVERLLFSYAGHHSVQLIVNRLRCSVPTCERSPSFVRLVGPSDGRSGKPAQDVGPGAC
jgi:hypothetical protein